MLSRIIVYASTLLIVHLAGAQTPGYTVLYQFPVASGGPMCSLVETSPGVYVGGTVDDLFSITSDGAFTTLFTFGSDASLGTGADAGVIQGSTGLLYGTTVLGASSGGAWCISRMRL